MNRLDKSSVNSIETSVLKSLFPVCDRESKRNGIENRKEWQNNVLSKLSVHNKTRAKVDRRVATRGVVNSYVDNLMRVQGQH